MSVDPLRLGLAIESSLAIPTASNYRPLTWPPARDWPVVVDAVGHVVSRWGDPVWRLDPWAGKPTPINFGDGPGIPATRINAANADLLRRIVGWWLWGPHGVRAASTLKVKFNLIRPLFALCSRERVLASDLMRFPGVAERLLDLVPACHAERFIQTLHTVNEQRDDLGFTILNREGIARLEASIPLHETRQTPYMPSRIWRYQVSRLRLCLDEFLAHREQVEDCFRFCVSAYANNYGSLDVLFKEGNSSFRNPFRWPKHANGARSGREYFGPFALTAARFGIEDLLNCWVGARGRQYGKSSIGVDSFSGYLTLVSRAGLAYVLNFSLMRIEEAWNLRTDCLHVEVDPAFGPIYTLHGVTSKTVRNDEAIWITSPSAKVAVDAMSVVARLRIKCGLANPARSLGPEEARNPFLQTHVMEPWTTGGRPRRYELRHHNPVYLGVLRRYPKLLDLDQLRITQQDLDLARLVTPTLDSRQFSVGSVWPLSWHQLRRTGAVNMQASGLVSDVSLQLQLKHVSRAMSLYYGRGYSHIRLQEDALAIYVRTLYETLGRELSQMAGERYASPHGDVRKAEIVRLIDVTDVKKLTKLAEEGHVACRRILLGVCTNREPCPYGGIESVAHCGGGDGGEEGKPCPDVLYDRRKLDQIKRLERQLDEAITNAPPRSPLRASLEAQKRSIRSFFHVVIPD